MPLTHHIPGLVLIDHEFTVPLDYANPKGGTISVFAREVVAPANAARDLPWLLFLQGGPGSESPRPEANAGWLKRALKEYRILLLDQRGTGLSTPVLSQALAHLTPQQQADYLRHFRADSIVKDAELIRPKVCGENTPWSVLGQSYGGFCNLVYLSQAPEGLKEVFFTGGLPPALQPLDEVYRATYQQVLQNNRRFYERFPRDIAIAQEIASYLKVNDVRLSNGDRLSPRRFQQLGFAFGMENGFQTVHYLLEKAFVQTPHGKEIGYPFLKGFLNSHNFDTNPIFSILHEPIYCEGAASRWSAHRIRSEYPEFEIREDQPVYFTGEMIYPWMFDEIGELRPLKEAAEILAAFEDWPALYDFSVLEKNEVPCAAAVYYHDMYVERKFSLDTADHIRGIQLWITNEYEHSALRMHGEAVLDRLIGMVRGEV